MLTIGFTTVYYTLWNVEEPYEEKRYYDGMCIGSVTKQNVNYIQNLSMDFEKAKEKVKGEYVIDLDLKSHNSFTRVLSSNIKNRDEFYPQNCFSFGKLEGSEIMASEDIWQLDRAYQKERSPRRKVYARRRLIELGNLVKYTWYSEEKIGDANWGKRDENGNLLPEDIKYHNVRHNYTTPEHVERIKSSDYIDSLEKGHLFNNGEKVTLEIKLLPSLSFGFDGTYGRTYIETYATKDGKMVKYMGSSPVDISEDEFVKVTATIKHDSYNGVQETKLLRIKFVK